MNMELYCMCAVIHVITCLAFTSSNGYYIPGTAGVGVSVGVVNSAHSQSGSVTKVMDLLCKQMQLFTLSFDSW